MCLQQMVESKFGKAKWSSIMEKSGLPRTKTFVSNHQIDDDLIYKVIGNTCDELDITIEQAADAFGNYWMTEFAAKKYYAFVLTHQNARSFLLSMTKVHDKITNDEKATPPKFEFEELSENMITMTYNSKRNLEVFWLGLIKGVGDYFNENIEIKELGKSKVELTFTNKIHNENKAMLVA